MFGAALATAILSTACGQSEEVVGPPAPGSAASPPAAPVSDFAVAGQDVTFLFGRGHLRMPDGWQRLANSGHPLEIEIESARHRKSADTWAICRLTKVSAPNFALASQDTLNRYIDTLWESTVARYMSTGVDVAVDYPVLSDGIRAKSLRFTIEDTDMLMYGIALVNGPVLHGTMISCDGSSPMAAQDRTEIAALAASFRYDRAQVAD
jgi:hypothetical protein